MNKAYRKIDEDIARITINIALRVTDSWRVVFSKCRFSMFMIAQNITF